MKGGCGVVADHIQAIHSHSPILRSMKMLGQPVQYIYIYIYIKHLTDEILADENLQSLQDEGVDYSSRHMRAFIWDFEGSHRVP